MPNITAQVGETLLLENGIAVTFVSVEGGEVRMAVNSHVLARHRAVATEPSEPGRQSAHAGTAPVRPRPPFDA